MDYNSPAVAWSRGSGTIGAMDPQTSQFAARVNTITTVVTLGSIALAGATIWYLVTHPIHFDHIPFTHTKLPRRRGRK